MILINHVNIIMCCHRLVWTTWLTQNRPNLSGEAVVGSRSITCRKLQDPLWLKTSFEINFHMTLELEPRSISVLFFSIFIK